MKQSYWNNAIKNAKLKVSLRKYHEGFVMITNVINDKIILKISLEKPRSRTNINDGYREF